MKKWLVLYLVPASVLQDWSKTDPEMRKAAEEKMRAEWNEWMSNHAKMLADTGACGKTKRVSSSGTSDTKNDIHLYSFVEAESQEAAVKSFEGHPHLQIPQSSIEIMEIKPITGM
jgi:ABC-type taurine transport system substrate-binding protein